MKPYLISLGVGLLVGLIYAFLGVRSPAPPAIALLGLLGMLIGETAAQAGKLLLGGTPIAAITETGRSSAGSDPLQSED